MSWNKTISGARARFAFPTLFAMAAAALTATTLSAPVLAAPLGVLQLQAYINDNWPTGVTVTPDGKHLYGTTGNATYNYQTNMLNGWLYHFKIDSITGALSIRDSVSTQAGTNALVAHPSGRFLYVGGSDGTLYAYTLGTDGSLSGGALFPVGRDIQEMALNAGGTHLFVLYTNGDPTGGVAVYAIDSARGGLTAYGNPFPTGNPSALALSPNGRHLLVANAGVKNLGILNTYTWDTTGGTQGTLVDTASLPSSPTSQIVVRALESGEAGEAGEGLVYTANSYQMGSRFNKIAGFRINAEGKLARLTGFPVPSVFPATDGLALNPVTNVLYALCSNPGQIAVYAIDPVTGALTQRGRRLPTGQFPTALAVTHAGTTVYTANWGLNGASNTGSFGAYFTDIPVLLKVHNVEPGSDTLTFVSRLRNDTLANISAAGFYYGKNSDPTAADSTATASRYASTLAANVPFRNFILDSTYFVRPFLRTAGGGAYTGPVQSFVYRPFLYTFPVDTAVPNAITLRAKLSRQFASGVTFDIHTTRGGNPYYQVTSTAKNSAGQDTATLFVADTLRNGTTYHVRARAVYNHDNQFYAFYGPWRSFTYRAPLLTESPTLSLDSFTVKAALGAGRSASSAGFLVYRGATFPAVTRGDYDTSFARNGFSGSFRHLGQTSTVADSFSATAELPGNPAHGMAGDSSSYGLYQIRPYVVLGNPPRLTFGKLTAFEYQPAIRIVSSRRVEDSLFVKVRIDPRALTINDTSSHAGCDSLRLQPSGESSWDEVGFRRLRREAQAPDLYQAWFVVGRKTQVSCFADTKIRTGTGITAIKSRTVVVPASP